MTKPTQYNDNILLLDGSAHNNVCTHLLVDKIDISAAKTVNSMPVHKQL